MDYRTLPDEELASRVAAGDSSALETLYRRHARPVYSFALSLVREREAAEEILQDTFLRLWRSRAAYDPNRGRLLSWLLAVTHHRAVDEVRRRRAAHLPLETLDSALGAPSHERDGSAMLSDQEGVGRALAQLPDAHRRPIMLAYYHGLTQSEIAARLQIPLGTVKTRTRAGMGQLRQLLAKERLPEAA